MLKEALEIARLFPLNSRVEMHPSTDAWMSGDRYGTVEKIGQRSGRVHVRMDKSGRVRRVFPHNLQPV